LTLTELPERFRFKTGGDRTVRGYGYEELSTNRNGANHLLVGSVEYEYRVGENWSLAAFADIGNAFNDFSQRKLKRGVGVGFRWYTMIGPLRVDFAQALDEVDDPWRLHFTIGTQLL
jgi:translocation and assembly module TamA